MDRQLAATGQLGLRSIAILEASKAVIALLAGTGVVLHRQLRPVIHEIAAHLHFNPGHTRPLAIVQSLGAGASTHLRLLAIGVLVYAGMRLVEAAGLWRGKMWALWFGAVSAAAYLPFDLVKLFEHPGALTMALVLVNGAVVGYLAHRVAMRRPDAPQVLGADEPRRITPPTSKGMTDE
jgi:uncharacterized membrane protein (DUF2068 family)